MYICMAEYVVCEIVAMRPVASTGSVSHAFVLGCFLVADCPAQIQSTAARLRCGPVCVPLAAIARGGVEGEAQRGDWWKGMTAAALGSRNYDVENKNMRCR